MKRRLYLSALALLFLGSVLYAQNRDIPDQTKDRPIKIRSKPIPGIRVEAARHKIKATVILLVEFRDTGKIGDVVCINEAGAERDDLEKYGLVKESIRAAKGIRFDPEVKQGQAVTVKKQIQFSFNIY